MSNVRRPSPEDYLPATHGNAPTFGGKPCTLDDLLAAVEKLKAIPKNDKWVVIDPNGNISTGTIEQVLPGLMAHHPLIRPMFPMEFRDE